MPHSTHRIDIKGSSYRKRRGKLVRIPDEWVDQVAHPQTIRKRQSKLTRKLKNLTKFKNNDKSGEYLKSKHGMDKEQLQEVRERLNSYNY